MILGKILGIDAAKELDLKALKNAVSAFKTTMNEATEAGGFTGLIESSKAFTSTLFGGLSVLTKFAIGIGGVVAAGIALKKLSDELNLTYEGAFKNTEESLGKFNEINSEIKSLEFNVDGLKNNLTSLSDKYDIELDGTEAVGEIIDKLNNVNLSSEDNKILENIVNQNEQ